MVRQCRNCRYLDRYIALLSKPLKYKCKKLNIWVSVDDGCATTFPETEEERLDALLEKVTSTSFKITYGQIDASNLRGIKGE